MDSDKIGTSVYFWAFPSKALAQRQSQLSQLREKLDASKSKSAELNKVLENASSGSFKATCQTNFRQLYCVQFEFITCLHQF